MSLRARLTITLGSSFFMLWGVAATWMLCHLQTNLSKSLDDRLASAAHLVVSIAHLSPLLPGELNSSSALDGKDKVLLNNGMACQVASIRGEILLKSYNSPDMDIGSQGEGYHNQVTDGIEWRTYTLVIDGIRISTADRVDQRYDLKLSILLAAALPVLLALIGSLLLLWWGLGKGLEPLRRIKDALVSRNADCLDPLEITRLPSELEPLVASQNELLVRIAEAIERERRLTGDAAHELRSPLTAIKTHIQIAQISDGETTRNALTKAEEGADRLQKILEQLLLLARVEGCLSFDEGYQALPQDVVRQALMDSSHQNAVDIDIHDDIALSPLDAPAALVTVALRNLISNAIRHTKPGTRVNLTVTRTGDMACFAIRDWGEGIPNEELRHITKRFWHTAQNGGSGLGLAIVNAIAVRCKGEFIFDNVSSGFEAIVRFPLLPAKAD